MMDWTADWHDVLRAKSTEQLQAYVAMLRLRERGLNATELRGLTVALAELDRRGDPEVRP